MTVFHDKYVVVKNARIHYRILGKGEPLIIIHGWGGTWPNKDKFSLILSEYFRVIIPDLPGYGETEELKEKHTMETYPYFLKDFANGLDLDKFYLLGHSMGTIISIKFSVLFPDRIKKLVLIGTPFRIFNENRLKRLKELGIHNVIGSPLIKTLLGQAILTLGLIYFGEPVERIRPWIETFKKSSSRALTENLVDILEINTNGLYERLSVPNILIYGDKDRLVNFPSNMENTILIENAGHQTFLDTPETISKNIISFLKG